MYSLILEQAIYLLFMILSLAIVTRDLKMKNTRKIIPCLIFIFQNEFYNVFMRVYTL